MLTPYSLDDVIRAEVKRLYPDGALGRPLPPSPEEEAAVHDIMARTRSAAAAVRDMVRTGETDQELASVAPSQELAKGLFHQKLTALCLSGGGIRSASFCLGVLQALAQRRLLARFDYLSTVSGGGYIGAWLTAWASRDGWNMSRVEERLGGRKEPEQVGNLRDFTNYLTPRAGLMSADTWVGVATLARNLVLNWTLFLPLFLLTVAIPKFVAALYEELARQPSLPADAPGHEHFVRLLLIVSGVLYGLAELFISVELLKTQSYKVDEAAAAEARNAGLINESALSTNGKPSSRKSYGAGNVLVALTVVCLVAASACVATSVLTEMKLTLTPLHALIFGICGAAVWLAAFLVACVATLRLRRRPAARAAPGAAILDEAKQDFAKLTAARTIGGAAFGVALLVGFVLLGGWVADTKDDRYAIVCGVLIFIVAHLVGGTAFSALSSRISRMDDALEWSARAAGWLIAAGVAWAFYATLVLLDPRDAFGYAQDWGNQLLLGLGGLSGLAAALFGYSRKSYLDKDAKTGRKNGFDWSAVALLSAIVFFVVLVLECSYFFDKVVFGAPFAEIIAARCLEPLHLDAFLLAFIILGFWTLLASWFVNVNKFSLHGFYRNRLIRAYLGASNLARVPNAFTGFDPDDNIDMAKLHAGKPLLMINMTLNLARGDKLAWQERKASSFSVSPIAAGNPALGYRPAEEYGQAISLGTTMAISGAAVSPNMGYHSSPVLTFVMTLFNARLGWWLGNPRREAWKLIGPRQAFWAFLMELFGYTTDANRFIYLSDGGHFENLGIYEMLLRRCRTIVAIDAGCDADLKFDDLGNLVRKARIDFGVEINFKEPVPPIDGCSPMRLGLVNRPHAMREAPYCIVGEISYPGIEETGALIYIKAAIHGDEPEDVWSYAAAHEEFPHESTGDQFFSESQFESYRRLGLYIGAHVFGGNGEPKSHAVDIETRAKESARGG